MGEPFEILYYTSHKKKFFPSGKTKLSVDRSNFVQRRSKFKRNLVDTTVELNVHKTFLWLPEDPLNVS